MSRTNPYFRTNLGDSSTRHSHSPFNTNFSTESTQRNMLTQLKSATTGLEAINTTLQAGTHPPQTPYDFEYLVQQMTMKNITTPDMRFRQDEYGRPGWRFVNDLDQDGSNLYWYNNFITLGDSKAITRADFTSVYAILTMDRVGSTNCLPFIAMFSLPLSTADAIPTFAHSRWVFTVPSGTSLYNGEQVLMYVGTDPGVHPEISHRIQLQLNTISSIGERLPSEVIYFMSINTASGQEASQIDYIAQAAGFATVNDAHREYIFDNSLERQKTKLLTQLNFVDDKTFTAKHLSVNLGTVSCGNINTSITNASLNTNLYASSGTGTVPVAADENGRLLVKLESSSGTTNNMVSYVWTADNFTDSTLSVGACTASIDTSAAASISVFGDSTSTGGGMSVPLLIWEYSTDGTTWYKSPTVISLMNGLPFEDTRPAKAPYVRFSIGGYPASTINLNVVVLKK